MLYPTYNSSSTIRALRVIKNETPLPQVRRLSKSKEENRAYREEERNRDTIFNCSRWPCKSGLNRGGAWWGTRFYQSRAAGGPAKGHQGKSRYHEVHRISFAMIDSYAKKSCESVISVLAAARLRGHARCLSSATIDRSLCRSVDVD